MADSNDKADLWEQLAERLEANLSAYFDGIRNDDDLDPIGAAPEIAAVFGAYHYITEQYDFTDSEMRYLLRFRNPLSVVADRFQIAGIDDHSDIMWDIFDKEDALQDDSYERMPDDAAMKPQLFARLDENLEGIMDINRAEAAKSGLFREELLGIAERITAVNAAHAYLKNEFEFEPGDIEYLLQFRNPLQIVAAAWPDSTDRVANIRNVVREVLDDREFELQLPAPPETADAAEAPRDASEKPSVMEQIRQARSEAKENPAPRKDGPAKDRGPEL